MTFIVCVEVDTRDGFEKCSEILTSKIKEQKGVLKNIIQTNTSNNKFQFTLTFEENSKTLKE